MALSKRVQHLTGAVQEWEILRNPWSPSNPSGYVNLGIAENHLMHQTLADYLHKTSLSGATLTYGDGSVRLRKAIAQFLTEQLKPTKDILSSQIVVTSGLGAAIELLAWALADLGDAILLGRPFYDGFSDLLTLRPGAHISPVSFGQCDPLGPECVRDYEDRIVELRERGTRVAGLMLCHPNNPLGRCYPRHVLIELMKLCHRYQIHLISDEAYALSVFSNAVDRSPTPVPFHSLLSIEADGVIDRSLVHVLWGMSKDFGASGFRLGAIITQHTRLHEALGPISLVCIPSTLSEYVACCILEDTAFVTSYIQENQRKLSERHEQVVSWAKKQGIRYETGANAGLFLWVDLGTVYCKHHGYTKDLNAVILAALEQRKVYLASSCSSEQPGWFRIVFAKPKDYLDEGLARITAAIQRLPLRNDAAHC